MKNPEEILREFLDGQATAATVYHVVDLVKTAMKDLAEYDAQAAAEKALQPDDFFDGLADDAQVTVALTGRQVTWLHKLMNWLPATGLVFEKTVLLRMATIADQLEQAALENLEAKVTGMCEPIRWDASIFYKHDGNILDECKLQLEELGDLHDYVETGPCWDCIQVIEIRRVAGTKLITVEEAAKL